MSRLLYNSSLEFTRWHYFSEYVLSYRSALTSFSTLLMIHIITLCVPQYTCFCGSAWNCLGYPTAVRSHDSLLLIPFISRHKMLGMKDKKKFWCVFRGKTSFPFKFYWGRYLTFLISHKYITSVLLIKDENFLLPCVSKRLKRVRSLRNGVKELISDDKSSNKVLIYQTTHFSLYRYLLFILQIQRSSDRRTNSQGQLKR